jgi:hypothetical protein
MLATGAWASVQHTNRSQRWKPPFVSSAVENEMFHQVLQSITLMIIYAQPAMILNYLER